MSCFTTPSDVSDYLEKQVTNSTFPFNLGEVIIVEHPDVSSKRFTKLIFASLVNKKKQTIQFDQVPVKLFLCHILQDVFSKITGHIGHYLLLHAITGCLSEESLISFLERIEDISTAHQLMVSAVMAYYHEFCATYDVASIGSFSFKKVCSTRQAILFPCSEDQQLPLYTIQVITQLCYLEQFPFPGFEEVKNTIHLFGSNQNEFSELIWKNVDTCEYSFQLPLGSLICGHRRNFAMESFYQSYRIFLTFTCMITKQMVLASCSRHSTLLGAHEYYGSYGKLIKAINFMGEEYRKRTIIANEC